MFERNARNGHNDLFFFPQIVQQLLEGVEPAARTESGLVPPVDVLETATEVRLVVEVAGLDRESMKVTLENNVLSISGEKNRRVTPPEGAYFRGERRFGKFARTFKIPTRVDSDKIEARYADGLLEIVMPKVPEVQPRRIEIKSA